MFVDELDAITLSLTVNKLKPQINVVDDDIVGTTIEDYIDAFAAGATEITADDLIAFITVDSSNVDLSTVGIYQVEFTVSDEENTTATKQVQVVVEQMRI